MTAADKIKALPLPEPHGHLLDDAPDGVRFQRDEPTGIAALVHSTMPVYTYADMRALIDAAAAIAARQDAVMAQVVEALRPLAAMAQHFPTERKHGNRPSVGPIYQVESGDIGFAQLTVEDLHAAAAALRAHKEME